MKKWVASVVVFVLAFAVSLVATTAASATNSTDFISTWDTRNTSDGNSDLGLPASSDANSVTLPLVSSGTYNFTVNWGDGPTNDTITAYNDAAATHSYATPGTYTITISGTITGFAFQDGGDKLKLIDISQWGSLNLGNSGGYFQGAANFNASANDSPDLTGTTSFENFFQGATSFNGAVNSWNVSNVTNMNSTFEDAWAFNKPLNNWNVSNVEQMRAMFREAYAFNQDITMWNVSKVWHFGIMFETASSFNQNLGAWDITGGGISGSRETQMDGMLGGTAQSSENYGLTLIGWSQLANINSMHANGAGNHAPNEFQTSARYSSDATVLAARAALVTNGWVIDDGGSALLRVGQSHSVTKTYHNGSGATQTFDSVTLGGDSTQDYVIDPSATTCIGAIADNTDCSIVVTFTPIFEGHRVASLYLHEQGADATSFIEVRVDETADGDCESLFTDGNGVAGDPYLISTLDQLNCITAVDANGVSTHLNKAYQLTADIDLGGDDAVFNPIGWWDNGFTGIFDGNGHTLSNMTSYGRYAGFMPWPRGAVVKNLTFTNANVTSEADGGVLGSYVDGNSTIENVHVVGGTLTGTLGGVYGGIAGFVTGASFIECSSTAAIEIDASGAWVGGLIGQFDAGSNLVDRSFAGGSVDFVGQSGSNWAAVGGLVGGFWNTPTNSIVDSYSTAALSSRATGTAIQLGGIVGYMNTGSLTNSMALGSISGTTDNVVNGFVGFADAGPAPVTLTGNFWDTATTGVATDALEADGELTGLGATELSTLATFTSASWGIDSTWDPSISWFLPADSYPVLTWQGASASNPVSGSGGSGGSGGQDGSGDSGGLGDSGSSGGPGDSGSSGSSNGSSGPSGQISLGIPAGSPVAGATISLDVTGLQDTAAFDVVVRSTPQTLATGNAVGGAVHTSATIPTGLEAGWHTLTFTSTAADGSPYVQVLYFKISASGTLLTTTSTIPAELASTGVQNTNLGGFAALGVFAGLMLVAASAYRRRKARLS